MKASQFSDARRQPSGGVDFTSRSRRRKCPHDPQPGHRARRPPRGPGVRVGSCSHRLALRDLQPKLTALAEGYRTDLGQGPRALRPRHSLRGRTISPSRRSRCSPTATSPSPGPDLRRAARRRRRQPDHAPTALALRSKKQLRRSRAGDHDQRARRVGASRASSSMACPQDSPFPGRPAPPKLQRRRSPTPRR